MNFRITENIINRSQGIKVSTGPFGAMVLDAEKGPSTPVLVDKGDTEALVDLFGLPNATFPDVSEAVAFNKKYPIWVCTTRNVADKFPGIAVQTTKYATFNPTDGVDNYDGLTEAELDAISNANFTDASTMFFILAYSPREANDMRYKVTYDSDTELFTVFIEKLRLGVWEKVDPVSFSLIEGKKDGFGRSVYYEDVLEGNIYLKVVPNPDAVTAWETTKGTIAFSNTDYQPVFGGSKTAYVEAELISAWDNFKSRRYDVKIFFDNTADPAIPGIFDDINTTYHVYSQFLSPLPLGTVYADLATIRDVGNHLASYNNPNSAFSWIWHKEKNPFGGVSYWTSLVGSWASKIADLNDVYYGLAAAGHDENNHGGYITGRTILESEIEPSDTELQGADALGVNPICLDFGSKVMMIMSNKSGQSPTVYDDLSTIGHVMLYNTIRKYIRENVLVYQGLKLNDDTHQRDVRNKISNFLQPILGLRLLQEDGTAVVCDNTVNTDIVKAAGDFVATVVLKITPFSEGITVNYIYTGQTNTLEEVLS